MYIALYNDVQLFGGLFSLPSLQQSVTTVQHPTWVLTLIPLCLFAGAMGKSAQVRFMFGYRTPWKVRHRRLP